MLYACVLAGGRSSRMGQDKAELVLENQTLLQRAQALLQASKAEHVLVSGRPELPLGFPDLLPHCGPPGALYATLDYLNTHFALDDSLLLLIPVDMPLLTLATLQALVEQSRDVQACHYDGEVFPCVVKASTNLHQHLHALFQEDTSLGGRRSMKALFSWLDARSLPLPPASVNEFMNVNSPEDWQAILAAVARP